MTLPIHSPTDDSPVKRKILVVDDNQDIRRLIRMTMLEIYEILEAEDAASALELVRQERPDLLILDIMMPGDMDGLDVLEIIKSDPELRQTLVVMLTARGQASDYQFGIKKGADAYFVKPFSPLLLMQWINNQIGGPP